MILDTSTHRFIYVLLCLSDIERHDSRHARLYTYMTSCDLGKRTNPVEFNVYTTMRAPDSWRWTIFECMLFNIRHGSISMGKHFALHLFLFLFRNTTLRQKFWSRTNMERNRNFVDKRSYDGSNRTRDISWMIFESTEKQENTRWCPVGLFQWNQEVVLKLTSLWRSFRSSSWRLSRYSASVASKTACFDWPIDSFSNGLCSVLGAGTPKKWDICSMVLVGFPTKSV